MPSIQTLPFEIDKPVTFRLLPVLPRVIPFDPFDPQVVSFAKSAMFPEAFVIVLLLVLTLEMVWVVVRGLPGSVKKLVDVE